MFYCLSCQTTLDFEKEWRQVIRCPKCGRFNRLEYAQDDKKRLSNGDIIVEEGDTISIITKRIGDKIQYCYILVNPRQLKIFKKYSQKSGEALEKFLYSSKTQLTKEEKNILYKLKAASIIKIQERIEYLLNKQKFIKLLQDLNF
jgi:hypothetical protein